MELHKAIKEIVNSKGAEMICNPQIINYLLDYQAFKEKPATKLILRAIIDSGYAENILALTSDRNGWEIKFRQYQHEFIDSCGYKEELAAYVFESIAYGLGLKAGNDEPEIKPQFNVDSFFDIPEVEQKQQQSYPQSQQKQNADPSDLYTIALSFFHEGKYQQAKGFIEKALAQYSQSQIPSLYQKLMGDVNMKMGNYQEAIKCYNECFVRKAAEIKVAVDQLRESLKKHEVKGFENSMFCYFFCMYYAKGISDAQWFQFVKSEARFGLIDAVKYCADNGINPIDDHFDIYFVDKNFLKTGDYLYEDGTFAHEDSTTKRVIARIILVTTSDYEQSQGWTHGYIIPVSPICYGCKFKDTNSLLTTQYLELWWSKQRDDLSFPHSHYTQDDLNHWDEINTVESEHYISINDYNLFPAFGIVAMLNSKYPVPISNTSNWVLPSVHQLKRISLQIMLHLGPLFGNIWSSSQSDGDKAISYDLHWRRFVCADKKSNNKVLPIAAF